MARPPSPPQTPGLGASDAQAFAAQSEEEKCSWILNPEPWETHLTWWPHQFREDLATVYPIACGAARSMFPYGMPFCCPQALLPPSVARLGTGGRGPAKDLPVLRKFANYPIKAPLL